MPLVKCIGCYELRREELNTTKGVEIVYNCPRYFPYMTTIGGLMRPASGIEGAVQDCPEQVGEHCILCSSPPEHSYGIDVIFTCNEHYWAWCKWLDEHPFRLSYIAQRGRSKKSRWIEVFREFIEDMRAEAEGTP